jgi:glycosyltransferase involved in cell wall biosynthesis
MTRYKQFLAQKSNETPSRTIEAARSKKCIFLMTDSLETGGSERQFSLLSRSLSREIFDVELGCLKRTGAFLEGLGEIAEFHLGGSFLTLRAQRARLELARYLRTKTAAIVHSFDFYSNIMLIPTAKWARIPVVIGSQRQIGDRLTWFQSAAQVAVFRMCDRVVCNSQAAAERLARQGLSKSRIVVIPNGLPVSAFAPSPEALPRQPGLIRIAYVARMNDLVKNHRGFLRAAARLASRFPSVEFVLVGDGPLRPGLEEVTTSLGIGARVHFLGERHDMAAILASIDISVLFSVSESMSNVVLEGMAAGIPVVASRVGGNPELIQDRVTGLLVKLGDEEELVDALATLVEQPDLRVEYGRRGKKLAQEKFRMDQITYQYEELYNALLEEKIGRATQIRSRSFGGRTR